MKKVVFFLKIAVSILISFMVVMIFGAVIFPRQQKTYPSNLAIKLILSQPADGKLSLKELTLENNVPADYRLNYPANFYRIRIFDNQSKELFSGEILRKIILPPPDTFDPLSSDSGSMQIKSLDVLNLHLPYFKNANNITIADEKNTVILDIPLKNMQNISK